MECSNNKNICAVVRKSDSRKVITKCRVANTMMMRMIGLLSRSNLEKDEGLWITPCTSIHTFFMRFNIDVAFLDREGKVIRIYSSLRPWMSWIHPRALGVLEVKAGVLEESEIKAGDILTLCPVF